MINKTFYFEVSHDPYNRYIISGDPRENHITISRQKRNHRAHGWTEIQRLDLSTIGAAATMDVADTIMDAVNLIGVLLEGNQDWLDGFINRPDKYRMSKTQCCVTFQEFDDV